MNPKDILEKYYHFAVVGVTPNQEKYGYKIFKRLLEKGYQTYGVSPIYQNIDDYHIYPHLEAIDHPIDVWFLWSIQNMPMITLMKCLALVFVMHGCNPGTYDDQLLQYMKDQGHYTYSCLYLVETE